MKKASSIFIVLLFTLFFRLPNLYAANRCSGYADVFTSHWFCSAVTSLQEWGILSVKQYFSPDAHLNRAEALKIIYESVGKKIPDYPYPLFETRGDQWYKKYFYHSYANHYIKPSNGKLGPAKPIKKGEFLALYLQMIEMEPQSGCVLKETPSNPKSDWLTTNQYKNYLCTAQSLGFASKEFDAEFINRAVAMQILYNSLQP